VKDPCPPAVQRSRLLELQAAIDASQTTAGRPTLTRDACGDWAIFGRLGHIYAAPEGFQLVISTGERPKAWTWIKKRLTFCRLSQDGDDEGVLLLDRIPTPAEAELIREALGIRQAVHFTETSRSARASKLAELREKAARPPKAA
jgi:hypothetical protein